jgi:hypothetical protein
LLLLGNARCPSIFEHIRLIKYEFTRPARTAPL